MFDRNIFVKRLNDLMDKHRVTKQSLANYIGISRPSVSQITHGQNMPSIDTLISISKFFNVSVDYLLGLTDNKEINK